MIKRLLRHDAPRNDQQNGRGLTFHRHCEPFYGAAISRWICLIVKRLLRRDAPRNDQQNGCGLTFHRHCEPFYGEAISLWVCLMIKRLLRHDAPRNDEKSLRLFVSVISIHNYFQYSNLSPTNCNKVLLMMNLLKTACAFCLLAMVAIAHADDYNEALAKELGADDYGMKSYVLVILKTGEKDSEITDKEERGKYFKGHFANMGRLAEEGKLVLAGPLAENPPQRGLFILNVESLEEAEELVKTDPAVKAGIFTYSLSKYYGSAALMKVNSIHKKLQKKSI